LDGSNRQIFKNDGRERADKGWEGAVAILTLSDVEKKKSPKPDQPGGGK
jgi:hypothetical protein